MKRLSFQSMLVLSERERKARRIKFDPRRTIIKGANDTGKSSLVKSIYWTFGAEPFQVHPVWKAANIVASVSFTVDDVPYRILRDGGRFTVFDGDGAKLRSCTRVTSELAPFLASLFNFPLRLAGRGDDGETQATPAFLFLPFYFDQDGSWTKNWSGFANLGQFSNWRADVAEFHTGVRPAEYYLAKTQRSLARRELMRVSAELDVVRSAKGRIEQNLPVAQFDVDIDVFRAEVDELLAEAATLQREEEKLRSATVRLHNERESLLQQIAVTEAAVRELAKDFEFAAHEVPDEVVCPTCRTTHTNSFAERFFIAQDEDRCSELLARLTEHIERNDTEIEGLGRRLGETMARSQRIQEILHRKRGEITLQEIVEVESKKQLRRVLDEDISSLALARESATSDESKAQETMDKFSDKNRRREICGFYLEQMHRFLPELNVLKMSEKTFKSLHSKIQESGSDTPRALLAYYYAILHTISRFGTSTFCPIIIDSPKQQDQDDKNWSKMVRFIADQQPAGSQLLLALVDEGDADLEGTTITLDTKYGVLRASDHEMVADEIRVLRDRSFD